MNRMELFLSGTDNRLNPIRIDTSELRKRPVTEFDDLEKYFSAIRGKIKEPVRLNNHTVIVDVNKFIDSTIKTLRHNSGNMTFMPDFVRLSQLRTILLLTHKK